jgi:hypothetical protein
VRVGHNGPTSDESKTLLIIDIIPEKHDVLRVDVAIR